MAHFYQNDTTTAGEALIAEAIAEGGVFTPTRIVIGSGDLPAGTQPSDMTALVSQKASCVINKTSKTEGESTAIVGAAFTNENVTEGFYFKEIGIYAKVTYDDDTESEEVLYSYGNAGDQGDYIAAYSQDTLVEFQIDIAIYVGSEANIDLSLKSDVYVSMEDYEELEERANDTYRKSETYSKEQVYTKGETYPKSNVYTKEEVMKLVNPVVAFLASRDGGAKNFNDGASYEMFEADSDFFWPWNSTRMEVFIKLSNHDFCIPCFRNRETIEEEGTKYESRYIEFYGTRTESYFKNDQSTGGGVKIWIVKIFGSWSVGNEPTVGYHMEEINITTSGITRTYRPEITLQELRNFWR